MAEKKRIKMPGIKSVTVYCGSAPGSDPGYIKLAQRLGVAIAQRGWRTVYGGGDVGLMGAVATSARNAGGKVLGVMPAFPARPRRRARWHREPLHRQHAPAEQALLDEADGLIVLPGGIGTLEEAGRNAELGQALPPPQTDGLPLREQLLAALLQADRPYDRREILPESFLQLMADTDSPEAALDALHQRAIVLDSGAGAAGLRLGVAPDPAATWKLPRIATAPAPFSFADIITKRSKRPPEEIPMRAVLMSLAVAAPALMLGHRRLQQQPRRLHRNSAHVRPTRPAQLRSPRSASSTPPRSPARGSPSAATITNSASARSTSSTKPTSRTRPRLVFRHRHRTRPGARRLSWSMA